MAGDRRDPELLDAERTDAAIDAVLGRRAGAPPDPELDRLLRHLAALHRPPVPPELPGAVAGHLRSAARRQSAAHLRSAAKQRLALRLLAAALGAVFLSQAVVYWLAGEWLAAFLRLAYEPHIYREAGIAYLALALSALLGAWRPAWQQFGMAAAVPAGILLGAFGLAELPHSPNPAAEGLHVVTAGVAAATAVLWWRQRRSGG